jgi:hypothetical protein
VLETAPMPIAEVNPALAGPLEHIVARAMARDVRARYQSATDLADDLQRFLEGREPSVPAAAASIAGDAGCIAAGLASGTIVLLDLTTGRRLPGTARCGCAKCRP